MNQTEGLHSVHLNLDDAWPVTWEGQAPAEPSLDTIDLRQWGPKLRYHGRRDEVEAFYEQVRERLTPFVLYGSGDFHYLAGVLLRRVSEPVTVISFDNHPDWDIRPPYWSCGGWVNRALEMPNARRVSVWGCGNFELRFPARWFANHKALSRGRLQVHAWAERQPPGVRRRFNCMSREDWKARFTEFSYSLSGQNVYVTVDLDCLTSGEAVTNWENGLFTAADVAWALTTLRGRATLLAGDLCGAYSPPQYARKFQRFAANWDHPKLPNVDPAQASQINLSALRQIWPALCHG